MPFHPLFITATGTGCGKTWVTRALARALFKQGKRVIALKPIETGVDPDPQDAIALSRVCGLPEALRCSGFLRWRLPLSPMAACEEEGLPFPSIEALAQAIDGATRGHEFALVEGAGGILVPIDPTNTIAELIACLKWPLVIVARDALGTLSHTLTAHESAERRGLSIRAIVLVQGPWSQGDPSTRLNASILERRLPVPVLRFPFCSDDDDALAQAGEPLIPWLFPESVRTGLAPKDQPA
ncbi:MAG: dethiobiotin synthase [Sandaracinaceae bacterium]|nr:dethiobiotin synthase [Sandaracinaceae bacterium]MDW8245897.1 dethiobiotin synthase [Sandaracinaceae bacterium]